MAAAINNRNSIKGPAILGDDDYMPLERLSVALTRGTTHEEGTFTICFWIYLLKTTTSGVIIRQGRPHAHAALPFLTMDSDRKLTLHPLPPPLNAIPTSDPFKLAMSKATLISENSVPIEKWVHIGCEVGPDVARLHVDGIAVASKAVLFPTQSGGVGGDAGPVLLSGGDGSSTGGGVQAFAHYVRVFPRPTVTNHFVKNPPLELQLDGSGGSEDNELEEGQDGVWSVVGGKASCRRNFALDVVLLDALGRSAQRDMEVVASLVYADDGMPVQKLRDDAEAPLLTTFDGVEFPSTERPVKLVHGRASFKLKISQLSSKCDNRLFRVCFDSLNTPKYPFLRALSRPIRCVSRNRHHRPQAVGKRLPGMYGGDNSPTHDDDMALTPTANPNSMGESRGHDHFVAPAGTAMVTYPLSTNGPGQPTKRPRMEDYGLPQQPQRSERSPDRVAAPCDEGTAGGVTTGAVHLPANLGAAAGAVTVAGTPTTGGVTPRQFSSHLLMGWRPEGGGGGGQAAAAAAGLTEASIRPIAAAVAAAMMNSRQMGMLGMGGGGHPEMPGLVAQAVAEAARVMSGAAAGGTPPPVDTGFPDELVYKYCLESMCCRAEFLKAAVAHKSDKDMANFATRVAQSTGCRHNGFEIAIARRLLKDGEEVWNRACSTRTPVTWAVLSRIVESSFLKLCDTQKRPLTPKDLAFMQRIAGCGDVVTREEFERLWDWMYPIALNLSVPQLRSAWESTDPMLILGFVSREEAESLLAGTPPEKPARPGTFLLRFAGSRVWPHPDAGALVVSYVGGNAEEGPTFHHRLLSVDEGPGNLTDEALESGRALSELLLAQPELKEVLSVSGNGPVEEIAGMNTQKVEQPCEHAAESVGRPSQEEVMKAEGIKA